jgi:hypothetical protein
MTIDLFATMAAIVDAPPPAPDRPIDGRDARAVWTCAPDARPTHEAFWFYYHVDELQAVRVGRWKASLARKSRTLDGKPGGELGGEAAYVMKQVPFALYDLELDPTESTDVQLEHPEVVAEIMRHVEAARAELGDAATKRRGSGWRGRPEPSAPRSAGVAGGAQRANGT